MSHKHLPILVPPITYNDLSSVISTKQAILLNNSSDLNEMVSQITSLLERPEINRSRWEAKRNEFISRFDKELSVAYENIPLKKNISAAELEMQVDKYREDKKDFISAKNSEEKEGVILIMLSEEPGFRCELKPIAEALNIKNVVCRYHLDLLIEKGYVEHVEYSGFMGISSTWCFRLTKDGRNYLVKGAKV